MTVAEFNKTYNQYRNIVFNYALSRVKHNYHFAEDITAYTFMRLWEQHPVFEDDRHKSIWLITIANRKIIDTFKSYEFRRRSSLDVNEIEIASATDLNEYIAHRDALGHIFSIEKRLPPRQKELFELYFMREMPSKQIARILHTADQSIRNQVVTIRKKIKAAIPRI